MIIRLIDEDGNAVETLDTNDIVGFECSPESIKILVSEIGIMVNNTCNMDLECSDE